LGGFGACSEPTLSGSEEVAEAEGFTFSQQGVEFEELKMFQPSKRIMLRPVKRWFSFQLLFGALLGLLAQEAAFATAPATSGTAMAAPAMDTECAEMMGIDPSQDDAPCKGLTLDCIVKMGCALPATIVSPSMPLVAAAHMPGLLDPLPVRRLAGRTFGPEPDPPLILG
jgi:hypothetical protein